jgi:hypothetical protein
MVGFAEGTRTDVQIARNRSMGKAPAPPKMPPDGQLRRTGQTGMNSSVRNCGLSCGSHRAVPRETQQHQASSQARITEIVLQLPITPNVAIAIKSGNHY